MEKSKPVLSFSYWKQRYRDSAWQIHDGNIDGPQVLVAPLVVRCVVSANHWIKSFLAFGIMCRDRDFGKGRVKIWPEGHGELGDKQSRQGNDTLRRSTICQHHRVQSYSTLPLRGGAGNETQNSAISWGRPVQVEIMAVLILSLIRRIPSERNINIK